MKETSDIQQQSGTEKNALDLFSRVQHAEFTCDNNELRHLLRDVRKEVLMLNKLVCSFFFFFPFFFLQFPFFQKVMENMLFLREKHRFQTIKTLKYCF